MRAIGSRSDPRVEKIDELIAAVRADPFEKGQGKPEPLRHELTQTCQDMFTDTAVRS